MMNFGGVVKIFILPNRDKYSHSVDEKLKPGLKMKLE